MLSSWIGLTLSYVFPETPSGPAIVLVARGFFVLSALLGPLGLNALSRKRAKDTASAVTNLSIWEKTP